MAGHNRQSGALRRSLRQGMLTHGGDRGGVPALTVTLLDRVRCGRRLASRPLVQIDEPWGRQRRPIE